MASFATFKTTTLQATDSDSMDRRGGTPRLFDGRAFQTFRHPTGKPMTTHSQPAAGRLPTAVRVGLLLAVSGFLWWGPLTAVVRLAMHDEAYTHILLIVPLSCALLYTERRLASPIETDLGWGGAWLVTALMIAGFARWASLEWSADVRLSVSMLALVLWWIGSFILCFGKRRFQSLLFPLCFLLWIVPLPAVALDEVVYFLQQQSAFAARIMFMAAGVPAIQDGVMLSIPNLDIEVARECSSIRSSMLLVITTTILAHLFLRSSRRKALLIAVAIPMAAIKNGFRIFIITELGTRVDAGFFDGNLHHRGGILFLGAALIMMSLLLYGLRRTEMVALTPLKYTSTE
jgi:exosortase